MGRDKPPAVVLLSGGLDSTTTLAFARAEGFRVHALTVRYGQRHDQEIRAARRVARAFDVEHRELDLDLAAFGGSALTDDIDMPRDRPLDEIGEGIPVTYVPARNTVLLSVALAWAETLDAVDLFIGVSEVDSSGYPDCRPAFIDAFAALANQATRQGTEGGRRFTIHAPLLKRSKADTIRLGQSLGVDYSLTWTCYDPRPEDLACGRCDACQLRLAAFAEVGIADPLAYA